MVDVLIKELEDLRNLNIQEEENQVNFLTQLQYQCAQNDQKVAERAKCESNLVTAQQEGDRQTREIEYLN